MTHCITTVSGLRAALADVKGSIGFVPTMGALHEGHATLIERSRVENAVTVLSIFVNPTQFNSSSDLEKYPRTLDADLSVASRLGVDYVFAPVPSEIYAPGETFRITEKLESDRMEGAHRPGHFDGMLTVVLKLLSIVRPQRAYFGEKDYQQLQLVRDLARAFFLETEIVGCPTVREPSGLALSSRNMRLTEEQRSQTAPLLYATLKSELSLPAMLARLQGSGFEVEYLEEHEGRRFVAARLGEVRLIDNICS